MRPRTIECYGIDVTINVLAEEYGLTFPAIENDPDPKYCSNLIDKNYSLYMPIDGCGWQVRKVLIEHISTWYPGKQFNECFEWCGGPATLAFSVLGANLTKKIFVGDIFQPSLNAVNETARNNSVVDRVETCLSDNFTNIPSDKKFDLIIGAPPHFNNATFSQNFVDDRFYIDPGWTLHRDFFNNVTNYMTDDCKIILYEASWGSAIETFQDMISDNGLVINRYGIINDGVEWEPILNYWWYMEIIKK